ncbi:MAG TPA: M28 family peptidase [Thermoplasmatales archaeon]|nr:M28 family peptidase [Thermoplasmatales archaeon]
MTVLDVIKEISNIGPHPGGSKEEMEVAKFLKDGIEPYCEEVCFEEFQYMDMTGKEKKSVNVIGRYCESEDNKKAVVVCTNIDTIRDLDIVVDFWEKKEKDVSEVPHIEGANEPNSAIAFLIYFAKVLAAEKVKRNFLLIGFGAQEEWYGKLLNVDDTSTPFKVRKKFERLGYLLGSRYHVLSNGVKNIDSVIAIDAVGIGVPRVVCRDSFGKSTLDSKLLNGLGEIKIRGFRYKPGKRTVEAIGCDHLPFRISGVPSTWIIAAQGVLKEKNFLGYILDHENIPNYATKNDTFSNLLKVSSEREIERNFNLISRSLVRYVIERSI